MLPTEQTTFMILILREQKLSLCMGSCAIQMGLHRTVHAERQQSCHVYKQSLK